MSSSELMDCTNEDDGIGDVVIDCVVEDGDVLAVVDSADGIGIDEETTVVSDEVVEG